MAVKMERLLQEQQILAVVAVVLTQEVATRQTIQVQVVQVL
jgi:hypothetical protein